MYFDQLSNMQESESWLKYTPKREEERNKAVNIERRRENKF